MAPSCRRRDDIPVTDEGLLRGDGVFEVMRLYDGRPFALDDHLERMARSAREPAPGARRAPPCAPTSRALLEAAGRPTASLRIVVTRGGHRRR